MFVCILRCTNKISICVCVTVDEQLWRGPASRVVARSGFELTLQPQDRRWRVFPVSYTLYSGRLVVPNHLLAIPKILTLHTNRIDRNSSSLVNSISLMGSGGNHGDLVHYRTEFVTLELRVLSVAGGLPWVPLVWGKGYWFRRFNPDGD